MRRIGIYIIGSKTGHTKEAGYALSSLSDINGHEMIIITLKATQKGIYYYNVIINCLLNSHIYLDVIRAYMIFIRTLSGGQKKKLKSGS